MAKNPSNYPGGEEMWVQFTAKTMNATNGSRTYLSGSPALVTGAVLVEDPFQWDAHDVDSSLSIDERRYINVTRTDSTYFNGNRYVVVEVPAVVNEFEAGSTTQRKGGLVKVVPLKGNPQVQALVEGTTDIVAGDKLIPVADQWYLVKYVTLTNINQSGTIADTIVGVAKESYATDAVSASPGKWISGY